MNREQESSIDLYWLPVGAGGHSVRVNGQIFEALAAAIARRSPHDLYHSALVVRVAGRTYVIEQGPAGPRDGCPRGVVFEGAVGSRWVARFRTFRYELRCWRDGVISDLAEAVESPRPLTRDPCRAHRLLELVDSVPALVWGRDESGAGEMWNSNSVIAWLIDRSGLDADAVRPPADGRAPGWGAGVALARRQQAAEEQSRSIAVVSDAA